MLPSEPVYKKLYFKKALQQNQSNLEKSQDLNRKAIDKANPLKPGFCPMNVNGLAMILSLLPTILMNYFLTLQHL